MRDDFMMMMLSMMIARLDPSARTAFWLVR
jgi:hypothetical protein